MKIGTTRVETFSDGVIAIILTIMVLSLKLPDFSKQENHWTVINSLRQMFPYLVTYTFSFLMIGIFWINHHHMFHLLEKTDEPLLLQNLFFLFWMSLIPIATAFAGAGPLVKDSVALYGFVMMMTTLAFSIMRAYSIRKRLLHKSKSRQDTNTVYRVSIKARSKAFIGTVAYLVSIPLAFVHVYLAFGCFLVTPVLFFIPEGLDDEELAEKISDKNEGTDS